MRRALPSVLLVIIWLAIGHHCWFEQVLAGAGSSQKPTDECPTHSPLDAASHGEGEYCQGTAIFWRNDLVEESSLVTPVLLSLTGLFLATSRDREAISAGISPSTPEEISQTEMLLASFSVVSNAPPHFFS